MYENLGLTHPLPAAADHSSNQWKFMKVDSNGRAALCSVLGERVIGVLQDKPKAVGNAGAVMIGTGVTQVVLGDTLAAGAAVATSAAGVAVACATGHYQAGILLSGGVATNVVPMIFTPGGVVNVSAMVGRTITVLAAADYTAESYPPVYIDSDGKAVTVTAGGGDAIGILQNAPDADENAIVMVSGVSNCVLAASLDEGAVLEVEATDRKLKAIAIDGHALGVLLAAGVEDDVRSMLILHGIGHSHT